MRKHTFLLLFIACTHTATLHAQACHDYACVIAKVERLLKAPAKDYQAILDNLDSAEGYPNSKPEELRALRRRTFAALEKDRKQAIADRDEAKRQTEIAKAEKAKAEAAEQKANAVLDKIYFYDGKFGLAYDKNKNEYGFIDKGLNTKVEFKYYNAYPFNIYGFAEVWRDGQNFLIDTLGKEYRLAKNINLITEGNTAVDLSNVYPRFKDDIENICKNKGIKILDLTYFGNISYSDLDSLFSLQDLEFLNLYGNQLDSIPNSINKLKKLRYLGLANNNLNSFELNLDSLPNLMTLDLHQNNITNFLVKNTGNYRLTNLDLSINKLSTFPNEINLISTLEQIDLSANSLKQVPSKIKNLKNLKFLILEGNQLSAIPDEISELNDLKCLLLGMNELKSIPLNIVSMKNLEYLNLVQNSIPVFEWEKIKTLPHNCDIEY